jgi:toxin ParE1/3/4
MTQRYRVNISATAESEARRIHSFIARDSPQAAVRWVREFRRRGRSLAHLPHRCEVIPEADDLSVDYRHLHFGNYRIIFEVENDEVTILHVLHAARQLDPSFFEQA